MPKARRSSKRYLHGALVICLSCGLPALSKSEFIARGDDLCRRFEKGSREFHLKSDPFQPGASPEDVQAAPRFLDFFAVNLPQLAGDLEGLGPPEEDRARLDLMLQILDDSGREFAQAKRAFQAGDHTGAQANLNGAFGRLEQAGRAAQEYGFKDCGSPPGQTEAKPAGPAGPEVLVTASEYSFQMPPEISAGPHTFVIRNEGRERHLLSLVRLRKDITVQRLLDSEKAGEPVAELVEGNVGQSRAILPGDTLRFSVDLPPGNYGFACFIAAPDGIQHAYKGMSGQLAVKQP